MSDETHPTLTLTRGGGQGSAPEPLDLGQRVRALRQARGLTLNAAAREAGIARSTLSKIENGLMSPTYEAVKKLATGLDISVPQLFTPAKDAQVSGRMDVTRADDAGAMITSTYEHALMAGKLSNKAMLPYQTRVRARTMEEFDGWVRHDGEEFLFVLTGVVRLYTEFYEPVELKRGETAYYDASMGHNVISLSQDDATLLWVTSLA
jgi:transcriptional regulator with XRE-family HTH domain